MQIERHLSNFRQGFFGAVAFKFEPNLTVVIKCLPQKVWKNMHMEMYIFEFINCQFKTDNMQASWICLSRFVLKKHFRINVSFLKQ